MKDKPETLRNLLEQLESNAPDANLWQWVTLAKILREMCEGMGLDLDHKIEPKEKP